MVGAVTTGTALALPLLLAALLAVPAMRAAPRFVAVLPLAALPLLLAAFMGGPITLEALLLGLQFDVDPRLAPVIAVAGLVWAAAGWHAARQSQGQPGAWRYSLFHLLTLAGTAGVLLTQNLVGLYVWFALMTLAAYGLVVHDGRPPSLRAGRVYLVMALGAEALLLFVLLVLGAQLGNVSLDTVPVMVAEHALGPLLAALVFVGFAVKMGTMPLHVWLPLAHPQAPVPASAVLSGVIVKAGLIGWVRMLPLGHDGFAILGGVMLSLGLLSALAAAVLGLTQRNPKVVLAYSTVSQMGLITSLTGLALLTPGTWPLILLAITVFAVHHAVAKAGLFLAVGAPASLRFALMLWPALALAGVPFSSGALAKTAAKQATDGSGIWAATVTHGFVLSSVLTTVLMIHLLRLIHAARREGQADANAPQRPWPVLVLLLASSCAAWLLMLDESSLISSALSAAGVFDAAWPVLLALALAILLAGTKSWRWNVKVPEGDLIVPAERALATLAASIRLPRPAELHWRVALARAPLRALTSFDRRHLRLAAAGAILLAGSLLLGWLVLV